MPTPPLTVAIVHPENGRIVINESDLPAWKKKKGWSVEGEKAEAEQGGDDLAVGGGVAAISTDVTVKDAAEAISGLNDVEAVEAYTEGDGRKGVAEAADKRIEELTAA